MLDNTVYTISQDPASQTVERTSHQLTSKDPVIKNDIEITKYLDETDSTEKQKLSGAVFKATLISNPSKVYYSTITDDNGYCKISDLPYGRYRVEESTVPAHAYNGEFYLEDVGTRVNYYDVFIQLDKSSTQKYTYLPEAHNDFIFAVLCEELGFDSLGYQSLDGLLEAIGIDREKICTYCWTGKE